MQISSTRRALFAGGAAAAAIPAGPSLANHRQQTAADGFGLSIASDLERYASLGPKCSGGPGDQAVGEWVEARLRDLGFATHRQDFSIPFLDTTVANLSCGNIEVPIWTLPSERSQGAWSFSQEAPFKWLDMPDFPAGAIAVVDLPFRRWSSASSPEVQASLTRAVERQALALVLITNGPSGETLALNTAVDQGCPIPVFTLGSRSAAGLRTAIWAGDVARLDVQANYSRRPAFNVVGQRGGGGQRLVLSTPRSGWFDCVGERGSGLAAWLAVIEAVQFHSGPITLVCTSGHEWESHGAEHYLETLAPRPTEVSLWVHFGANFATRDAHDLGGRLRLLDTADPQRYLAGSPDMLDGLRRHFAGQPGLASPYPTSAGAAGELKNLIEHGYDRVVGVFGAHRFHHASTDGSETVAPHLVQASAAAFRDFVLDRIDG